MRIEDAAQATEQARRIIGNPVRFQPKEGRKVNGYWVVEAVIGVLDDILVTVKMPETLAEPKQAMDKTSESHEVRPQLTQDEIRGVFGVGQKVLVRTGTEWRTREILGITVLRDAHCPHCGMPLLGVPRFWFKDYGNWPLDKIMAVEDIDPGRVKWANEMTTEEGATHVE